MISMHKAIIHTTAGGQRFFATRHRDRFLIFNLCREREYDPALFDGRVVRIDVEDHNPPRMSQAPLSHRDTPRAHTPRLSEAISSARSPPYGERKRG
jgi:hypothetical protein